MRKSIRIGIAGAMLMGGLLVVPSNPASAWKSCGGSTHAYSGGSHVPGGYTGYGDQAWYKMNPNLRWYGWAGCW